MANCPGGAHNELKIPVHSAVNREFHCNNSSLKITLLSGWFNFPNTYQGIFKYAGSGAYVNNCTYFIIAWLSIQFDTWECTHMHVERGKEGEKDIQ